MKAILMSIRSQHLVNILNGKKTIELRTRFPKDFRGWVYEYITKGKPYMGCHDEYIDNICDNAHSIIVYTPYGTFNKLPYFNGKVAFRFWVDNVDTIVRSGMGYCAKGQSTAYTNQIANQSRLTFNDLQKYFGDKEGRAIHISKLEIFDKPKELAEFYKIKYRTEFEERYIPIQQAPQSWQYIYIEEDK